MDLRDATNLWSMYSTGVIGPYKDYIIAYHSNVQNHNSQQLFISANTEKKHKMKKPPKFEDLYSDTYKWWSMGAKPIKPDFGISMAKDMLASRGADTPDFVLKAIQEDKDASRD